MLSHSFIRTTPRKLKRSPLGTPSPDYSSLSFLHVDNTHNICFATGQNTVLFIKQALDHRLSCTMVLIGVAETPRVKGILEECGPCHMIAPTFEALSKQHTNVNFLKCDVDAAPDVAQKYEVSAMPTFIFLKGSSQVDMVRGANRSALEITLKKYATGSTGGAAFSGKGQTLGGTPSGTSPSTNAGSESILNLSPQAKVFLGLIGVYAVIWYFS